MNSMRRNGGAMKIIKKTIINLASIMGIILTVYLLSNNYPVFAEKTISAGYIIKSCENLNDENGSNLSVKYLCDKSYYSRFYEYAESKAKQVNLYKLNNANLLNENGELKINLVSGYYTGYESSKYRGYAVIDYNYGTYLVDTSQAAIVDGAKVLSTAVVSQIDGKYAGYSACGPTAAVILLNAEKNSDLHKDDLIKYSIKHNLNDQGSLMSMSGGMTSDNLIKLINAYGYSASNIYDNSLKPSSLLKQQIDSGKRAIVLVKYSGGIQRSEGAAHFVVVCGYKYNGEKLCFYYADSFYSSSGGNGLMKVSSNVLNSSMSGAFSEPNTILILE